MSGDLPEGHPGRRSTPLEGWFILQALQWRLSDSPWLIGVRASLNGTEVAPSADPVLDLDLPMVEARNGALGVTVGYDTRDNVFTPNRGFDGSVEIRRYDDAFLGDFDYWEGTAELKGFFEAGPGSLGIRTKGMTSEEDVPFWVLPAVGMRGVPARQYMPPSSLPLCDRDDRCPGRGGGTGWTP